MKILHIAEFGSHVNGIGTVVDRLYHEQQSLGHDVHILTTDHNLAYTHLPLCYATRKDEFAIYLDKILPDAVLFHSIWAMPYIGFAKVLNKRNIPYAVMMHGADSLENRKRNLIKKWLANVLWFNNFIRGAKTIIFLSQQEYENCLSKDINKNHDIIPNGCDSAGLVIEKNSVHTPLNIVYIGRLDIHHKGIDILLDALKLLNRDGYSDAHISFYGYGDKDDIEVIEKQLNEMSKIANYYGSVIGEDKINVLMNADAFILTSRYEGMPMGVLEAMSYGVPCILTPGTNMADDIVSAGAGWKTSLDAANIAQTIKQAVDDLNKDSQHYSKSAYSMSKKYNWKNIAEEHLRVLKRISL